VVRWLGSFSPAPVLSLAVLLTLAALVAFTGDGRRALPPEQLVTDVKVDELLHVTEEVEILADFEVLAELKRPGNEESRGPARDK